MIDHSWLIIISVCFFMIVLIFLVAIGFLIYSLIELKKIGASLNGFLKNTEEKIEKMMPVLAEAERTLRSVRKVSDDVGMLSENAKNLTEAATDIVVNLRAMSLLVGDLREGIVTRTSGVKAGFREAFGVLIKQLKERR